MLREEFINECKNCNIDDQTRKELCSICLTQKVMRGKWKLVIIWLLKDNKLRFSQLRKSISNISQGYLSSQLKELESDGLIIRKSYNEVPPKVEYYLSENGKKFIDVINQMNKWGLDYFNSMM